MLHKQQELYESEIEFMLKKAGDLAPSGTEKSEEAELSRKKLIDIMLLMEYKAKE